MNAKGLEPCTWVDSVQDDDGIEVMEDQTEDTGRYSMTATN